jgi:hypothetical protein
MFVRFRPTACRLQASLITTYRSAANMAVTTVRRERLSTPNAPLVEAVE